MSKKILVTGGSGFIGSHLIPDLIKQGYEVYTTTFTKSKVDNVKTIYIDLLDIGKIDKLISNIRPDFLIHLAWNINTTTFWNDNINLQWVQSTLELFKCFYKYGGERGIFMSTYAEYSWSVSGSMHETTSLLLPNNLYGDSKLSCTKILTKYTENNKYSFVSCRLFSVFGENNLRQTTSLAIFNLMNGNSFTCNYGETCRDFIYIDDVVLALSLLLDSDIIGVVNIGTGTPIKITSVLNYIGQYLHTSDKLFISQTGTSNSIYADSSKLRSIGWNNKFDVFTGLNKLLTHEYKTYYATSKC